MVAGANIIAQRAGFPDLHEQLTGHAASKKHIAHLHGSKTLIPQGNGGNKAHTQLALGHIHLLGMIPGCRIGKRSLRPQSSRSSFNLLEQGLQQRCHLFRPGRAHIKQFYGTLCQDAAVMLIGTLGGDLLHLLRLSQPGNPEGIPGTHLPNQLAVCVNPLIVKLRFHGQDQIPFFVLHIIPAECPLLQHRLKQQLLQKADHGLQHPVTLQGIPVLYEAAIQAGGLVVPYPAHQRTHSRTVEIIQPQGDGPQVRGFFGTPQQHRGNQRVQCRFCPVHGPQELNTQTALFKSLIRKAPQHDSGK